MIHSRKHMYEDTKKGLAKVKRQLNKLSYEELANKELCKKIIYNILEENKDNEFFEKITFYDKTTEYIKKRKNEKWFELLENLKKGDE